jgi:hypothetical protein
MGRYARLFPTSVMSVPWSVVTKGTGLEDILRASKALIE